MADDSYQELRQEWGEWLKFLKEAPVALFLLMFATGGAVYWFMNFMYSEHIASVDATLELNREKMGEIKSENQYILMSNRQLKQEATTLSEKLAKIGAEERMEESSMSNLQQRRMQGKTDDERTKLWQLGVEEDTAVSSKYRELYEGQYKAPVILIREALISRFTPEELTRLQKQASPYEL